jgi:hypothetical protein
MTRGELKKLFREWTEDYAARREEDRREREGVLSAGPRESWPSEIAKANREKQAGQEKRKEYGDGHENGHDGHSM